MEIVPGRRAGAIGDGGQVFLVQVVAAREVGVGVGDDIAVGIRFLFQQPGEDVIGNGGVFDAPGIRQPKIHPRAIGQSALPMAVCLAIADKGAFIHVKPIPVGLGNQLFFAVIDIEINPADGIARRQRIQIPWNAQVGAALHTGHGQSPAATQGTIGAAAFIDEFECRGVAGGGWRDLEADAIVGRAGVEGGLERLAQPLDGPGAFRHGDGIGRDAALVVREARGREEREEREERWSVRACQAPKREPGDHQPEGTCRRALGALARQRSANRQSAIGSNTRSLAGVGVGLEQEFDVADAVAVTP